MTTHTTASRWTYAEFARLPSDGNRHEVIEGELFMTPAPRMLHQFAVTQLIQLLGDFVKRHDLGWVFPGPVDVLFAEGDYLEPDLVFVRKERRGIISDRGIEAAPDLVVEVTSPSTAARDRGPKRERYAFYGVPEYWVVDPDPDAKRIEVYRLGEDAERPEIVSGTFTWRPGSSDGPALEVLVPEIVRGLPEE